MISKFWKVVCSVEYIVSLVLVLLVNSIIKFWNDVF